MTELVKSFFLDGLNTDAMPSAVPENKWTGASQVNFRDGMATRRGGYAATSVNPAACRPQHGLYYDMAPNVSRVYTTYTWYGGRAYGGTAAVVGQQTGGVDSTVTPAGWVGNAPGKWTSGLLNNFVPVLNCQTEFPVYWNNAGPNWQAMPNYDPTGGAAVCTYNALRVYREFVIGMGLARAAGAYFSDSVYWSDASTANTVPGTWVAAATNQAGSAILPGGGEVIDGCTLGEDFIIYKRWNCYRMRYVGGNYVMNLEPLFGQFGALSQNCIVEDSGKNYVFTGTDVIVHDGQRWQSMLTGRLRKTLVDLMYTATLAIYEHSFVHFNRLRRELWVNLCPTTAYECTSALIINVDTGEAGIYVQPSISHCFSGPNDRYTFMAYNGTATAASGRFYWQDSGNTADGTNITATLTREGMNFGQKPNQKVVIKWVRPHIRATGSAVALTVEVGGTNTPEASPTYAAAVTFTTGTSDKANILAVPYRFPAIRFGSADSVAHWQLTGFDVGYELGGLY